MSDRDFKILVREMREAQKRFFRNPQGTNERASALIQSRKLENAVDVELARDAQAAGSLFAEEVR